MVIILYLWYIQNGAPKLLLMAQPLKHPQSESAESRGNDASFNSAYKRRWCSIIYRPLNTRQICKDLCRSTVYNSFNVDRWLYIFYRYNHVTRKRQKRQSQLLKWNNIIRLNKNKNHINKWLNPEIRVNLLLIIILLKEILKHDRGLVGELPIANTENPLLWLLCLYLL